MESAIASGGKAFGPASARVSPRSQAPASPCTLQRRSLRQVVSWGLNLEAQERWARAQASAAGDRATLQALDDTASLPETDMKRITAPRKYRMSPSDLEHLKIFQAFAGPPPPRTPGDAADWIAGASFSYPKLAPRKAFIPIAGGHWACFTHPTAFVAALRRNVRPLAR
jgi:hypothetical protein